MPIAWIVLRVQRADMLKSPRIATYTFNHLANTTSSTDLNHRWFARLVPGRVTIWPIRCSTGKHRPIAGPRFHTETENCLRCITVIVFPFTLVYE